jgi:REP element-mobilizing transposase RayT
MRAQVWNLRSVRCFRVLRSCFRAASDHLGARVCEFSVQGNHIHLLCEAHDQRALARALQGLGVRIARRLNRLMSRHGRVLADRYHSRILRTPTEVARARRYLADNARHHAAKWGQRLPAGYVDPFSSFAARPPSPDACTAAPATWLLRIGWQRAPTRAPP